MGVTLSWKSKLNNNNNFNKFLVNKNGYLYLSSKEVRVYTFVI